MDVRVIVEILAAASAIVVAALTYLFAKQKEREADWRKWKYEQYANLVASLSGVTSCQVTREGQVAFARATNAVQLIAAQPVINALQALQQDLSSTALLSELIWEIRRDLQITKTEKRERFTFVLVAPK